MRNLLLILIFTISLFAKEQITLQLPWYGQFQFAGYYIAKHKGFYDEAGLDVKILDASSGYDPITAVKTARANYGVTRTSLVKEYASGEPLVAMMAVYQASPMMLLVRKDSGIKTVKDLRNKRIMITDDTLNSIEISAMMLDNGLSKDDFIIQEHSYDPLSLKNFQTDAMLCYTSNEPYILEKNGIATAVIHPKDYGINYYNDILFTSQQELLHNSSRAEEFYDATIRGWQWAFENIEQAALIMHEHYNPKNKSIDELIYEAKILRDLAFVPDSAFGEINIKKIESIAQLYKRLGQIDKIPPLNGFVYKKNKFFLVDKEREFLENIKTIRVAVDKNWPPLEFINSSGEVTGISVSYLKFLENRLGIEFILDSSFKNREDALESLDNSEIDIVSTTLVTPENSSKYLFSRPISRQSIVIVSQSNVGYINDINDLVGKKVAVAKTYNSEYILKKHYPQIEVVEVATPLEALRAVSENRAYATVDAIGVSSYLREKYNIKNVKISGETPYTSEVAFAFKKDNEILANIINKALLSMDSLEYATMHSQWIDIKQDRVSDYKIIWIMGLISLMLLMFMYYKNRRLDTIVTERTIELEQLNEKLQNEIEQAVEKNRAQEKLLMQQSKMAEIGSLLESIAHQWRQPLNILGLSMTRLSLMYGLDPKSDTAKILNIAEAQIQFMSQTIDDFRNFFKQDRSRVSTNIHDIINDVVSLLKPLMTQKKIEVELHVDKDIEALVYPNELKQVLINVINNSREAIIANNSSVRLISISCHDMDEYCVIEIEDTGGGIKSEILDKIFDPYFTTKFESQGTGIGLYMSKTIIEKHFQGRLLAKNTHRGAKIEVMLNKNIKEDESE